MRTMLLVAMTMALAAASGCSADDGGASGAFEIDAAVTGPNAPAEGTVAVIWVVSSGSPDYAYKFGDGTATGTSYMATLGTDPPGQAINSYGIGVGFVALFPAGTQIPDGVFDDTQFTPLGYSQEYAVIWKDPAAAGLGSWDAGFGARYSCARCVKAATGFDTFELAPCANVVIDLASTFVCNWT